MEQYSSRLAFGIHIRIGKSAVHPSLETRKTDRERTFLRLQNRTLVAREKQAVSARFRIGPKNQDFHEILALRPKMRKERLQSHRDFTRRRRTDLSRRTQAHDDQTRSFPDGTVIECLNVIFFFLIYTPNRFRLFAEHVLTALIRFQVCSTT